MLDKIDQQAIDAIASSLLAKVGEAGVEGLGERRDLEPASVVALTQTFGGRVEKSRRVSIPHWESVGQVDVVVRATAPADEFSVLAELKWCGAHHDILYEGVWDAFKMALATWRADMPCAYLVAGAHESVWAKSQFSDLYETGEHDPVELCLRDLGGRDHWLAWDALLYGGGDRYPAVVPARFQTTVVGRSAVGDAELRAVRVTRATDSIVPFIDGWPHGDRPAQARHPTSAPPSPVPDADDDIQWDPATDPANKELIDGLKSIGLWYGRDPDDYPSARTEG